MQNGDAEAAAAVGVLGAIGGMCCCFVIFVFGIKALFCWFWSKALKRVPEQHRRMSPGQAWLYLIPMFDFIWAFFLANRIPGSIRAALDSQNRSEGGDCGRGIGMAWAICGVSTIVFNFAHIGTFIAALRPGGDPKAALEGAMNATGGLQMATNALSLGTLVLIIIFTVTIVSRSKLLTK